MLSTTTARAMTAAPEITTRTTFTMEDALRELDAITRWWLDHSIDRENGGFYGEIDALGQPVAGARKHLVLHTRLLWFFSEAGRAGGDRNCRLAADRAYRYFNDHFDDPGFGGAYWSLEADGSVADDGKRSYGLCFSIYALCAYYRLTSDTSAITRARDYLAALWEHARDQEHGGFIESFNRNWTPADDMRLGEDDLDAPKTMNMHLHLVEACTALHQAAPNARSRKALRESIDLFIDRILVADTPRLGLYFDRQWNELPAPESFGHEIEASWLLWEAAETLGDPVVKTAVRPRALGLAEKVLSRALTPAGFVQDRPGGSGDPSESTWWVQAEALVGFLNADLLSGDHRWGEAADTVWAFTQRAHIAPGGVEWRSQGAASADTPDPDYRAGAWKGPYHTGRAMMEAARRLSILEAG